MTIYIAFYKTRWALNTLCFFSLADAEKQIEEWKCNYPSADSTPFFIKEEFVHGNNPFLNNSELID
jgi:hypothetical protein